MVRYGRAPGFLALLGLLVVSSLFLAKAEAQAGGLRYIEPGQRPVVLYPTIEQSQQAREAEGTLAPRRSSNLSYHGGTNDSSAGTIGVETAPKIYLVLWGSQWDNNDPSGEAAILESFFRGVGGNSWLNTVTQYCQGVARGTIFCNGAGTPAGNQTGMFVNYWYDNGSPAPSSPSQSQIAAEATNAAGHFGNTTAVSNASVQYVIATSHGNNSSGFGSSYCAYHSSTTSGYGDVAYTNMPYITDAGASCGANFNGLGPDAGITIVEGHEMAETITDQFPSSGWLDSRGSEIGDKCAWITTGNQGAAQDITLSTGTFAVQSLWSNHFNNNAGGCVISYP